MFVSLSVFNKSGLLLLRATAAVPFIVSIDSIHFDTSGEYSGKLLNFKLITNIETYEIIVFEIRAKLL